MMSGSTMSPREEVGSIPCNTFQDFNLMRSRMSTANRSLSAMEWGLAVMSATRNRLFSFFLTPAILSAFQMSSHTVLTCFKVQKPLRV